LRREEGMKSREEDFKGDELRILRTSGREWKRVDGGLKVQINIIFIYFILCCIFRLIIFWT